MKLISLLEKLEYTCLQGSTDQEVKNVVYDSRKVEEGSLFICIRGAVVDGHKFVPDVVAKGAKVLIVEEAVEAPEDVTVILVKDTRYAMAFISAAYFGYPAEKLKTIGITGTKGKTTTTYMVKSILENAGYKVGLIGTIEAIIGDKVIPAKNTTPESYVIQEYFHEMAEAGCDCVVMEVSSQGLMLHRTQGFVFDFGKRLDWNKSVHPDAERCGNNPSDRHSPLYSQHLLQKSVLFVWSAAALLPPPFSCFPYHVQTYSFIPFYETHALGGMRGFVLLSVSYYTFLCDRFMISAGKERKSVSFFLTQSVHWLSHIPISCQTQQKAAVQARHSCFLNAKTSLLGILLDKFVKVLFCHIAHSLFCIEGQKQGGIAQVYARRLIDICCLSADYIEGIAIGNRLFCILCQRHGGICQFNFTAVIDVTLAVNFYCRATQSLQVLVNGGIHTG